MYDARESSGLSGKSVAAFLLLPQFRECFKGFHHLWPVFMRGIALMFIQARLVPADHPAAYYGADGVVKTTIRDLFGEAWFTLKTTRATTFQYGMFAAIVMMAVTLIAAITTFALRIFFGVGEVAQAQIFSHPCNPYGGCTGASGPTDMQAVSAITGAGGLFDSRVNGNGISTDYALMVLDKILRQAATGTPGNGGALQNALTNLMQVYNSGVLLVAGAVMFWMVLSIVIDSAKTGMFGGGRHNMVWTPIRVVFALGIMIPLGNQGFSTGQYAVMKLAEWGSNFGSQGWNAYVNGVVADDSLLSPFAGNSLGNISAGLMKIMVCQVAYNSHLIQEEIDDQRQWIVVEIEQNPRDKWVTNRYTNSTDPNVCGTIKYGQSNPALLALEDKNQMLTAAGRTTPMDATSAALVTPATIPQYTNLKGGLQTAIMLFRNRMMGALAPQLQENANMGAVGPNRTRSGGVVGSGGPAVSLARSFACRFVATRFSNVAGSPDNPVGNLPTPINHCGNPVGMFNANGGYVTPAMTSIDATEGQQLLDMMMAQVENVYDGGASPAPAASAKGALLSYIQGTAPVPAGQGMMAEMKKRGWAGMGMWYLDIAQLNSALQSAREPVVTVEAGSVWTGSKGGFFSGLWNAAKCGWRWIQGNACRNSDLESKVTTAMTEYDRWWEDATRPGAAGRTTQATVDRDKELHPSSSSGIMKLVGFIKSLVSGEAGDALINWIIEKIWPRADNIFIFNVADSAAADTYPLAQLATMGHYIMWSAVGIMVGLSLLQILSCAEAFGFSAGCGLGISALANGLCTIGMTMLIAGIMIAFYLPILPFIRVAFAVLTWMVSVFEAVVMVPIAALAHLTTEGDGLTGGSARTAWILWLNVLMRPILVVFGFVGGMLIFSTFAVYFNAMFAQGAASVLAATSNPIMMLLGTVAYNIIYLGTLYTAANSSFKLMDLLPNALVRWMGGSPDHSMDDDSDGMMLAATQLLSSATPRFTPGEKKGGKPKAGLENGG